MPRAPQNARPPGKRTSRPAKFGMDKRSGQQQVHHDEYRMHYLHLQREYFSPYATRQ